MNMKSVIKARSAIGNILSGYNIPEGIHSSLTEAHDGLLAFERADTETWNKAMQAIAPINRDWEIG